jgi:hypothetical protein
MWKAAQFTSNRFLMIRKKLYPWRVLLENSLRKIYWTADQATSHHYTAKSHLNIWRSWQKQFCQTLSLIFCLIFFIELFIFIPRCHIRVPLRNQPGHSPPFYNLLSHNRPRKLHEKWCVSSCVISVRLQLTATTFQSFVSCNIHHLVFDVLPHLEKEYYFSDGASSQYKDCKNFLNWCYHAEEFHAAVEWNFISTSHGKNPCDGIGGTAKQHVAYVSPQATERNHILTQKILINGPKKILQELYSSM